MSRRMSRHSAASISGIAAQALRDSAHGCSEGGDWLDVASSGSPSPSPRLLERMSPTSAELVACLGSPPRRTPKARSSVGSLAPPSSCGGDQSSAGGTKASGSAARPRPAPLLSCRSSAPPQAKPPPLLASSPFAFFVDAADESAWSAGGDHTRQPLDSSSAQPSSFKRREATVCSHALRAPRPGSPSCGGSWDYPLTRRETWERLVILYDQDKVLLETYASNLQEDVLSLCAERSKNSRAAGAAAQGERAQGSRSAAISSRNTTRCDGADWEETCPTTDVVATAVREAIQPISLELQARFAELLQEQEELRLLVQRGFDQQDRGDRSRRRDRRRCSSEDSSVCSGRGAAASEDLPTICLQRVASSRGGSCSFQSSGRKSMKSSMSFLDSPLDFTLPSALPSPIPTQTEHLSVPQLDLTVPRRDSGAAFFWSPCSDRHAPEARARRRSREMLFEMHRASCGRWEEAEHEGQDQISMSGLRSFESGRAWRAPASRWPSKSQAYLEACRS
eukprot:TRINITY_DN29196_c0_g1_i1.p1 TRINITY_DN29196_c0_g1~~TRINITY_DN29196_c0_g1_i1.p1  ORF type:complete len:508 (+),score=92.88 TRINITY_DN29196_c0_g1_i1:94-1617(+)